MEDMLAVELNARLRPQTVGPANLAEHVVIYALKLFALRGKTG